MAQRGVDHSHPSSAIVKNPLSYTSTTPYAFIACTWAILSLPLPDLHFTYFLFTTIICFWDILSDTRQISSTKFHWHPTEYIADEQRRRTDISPQSHVHLKARVYATPHTNFIKLCEFYGFRGGVDEASVLIRCDDASLGIWLPTLKPKSSCISPRKTVPLTYCIRRNTTGLSHYNYNCYCIILLKQCTFSEIRGTIQVSLRKLYKWVPQQPALIFCKSSSIQTRCTKHRQQVSIYLLVVPLSTALCCDVLSWTN